MGGSSKGAAGSGDFTVGFNYFLKGIDLWPLIMKSNTSKYSKKVPSIF